MPEGRHAPAPTLPFPPTLLAGTWSSVDCVSWLYDGEPRCFLRYAADQAEDLAPAFPTCLPACGRQARRERRNASCGGRTFSGVSGTALRPGSSFSSTCSAAGSGSRSTTLQELGIGIALASWSVLALRFWALSAGEGEAAATSRSLKKGSPEGSDPSAGDLGVSPQIRNVPPSWPGRGWGDGRNRFFNTLLGGPGAAIPLARFSAPDNGRLPSGGTSVLPACRALTRRYRPGGG